MASKKLKVIAFHLPQFHSIAENDEWWGPEFTEWTNVKKARPLDSGHVILHPHADINYYDLRNISARRKQAELAKEHNIYGFCYHHYWFNGKLLLETPLELMLVDNEPNIKFCFNWANENWTRIWDGLESDMLIEQKYDKKDDIISHYEYLRPFFKHHNYICVNGAPVFCLYRIGQITYMNKMMEIWNDLAIKDGFTGIYFVSMLGSFKDSQILYKEMPHAEFNPNYSNYLGKATQKSDKTYDILKSWKAIEDIKKNSKHTISWYIRRMG